MNLKIKDKEIASRLFLGTGKFSPSHVMSQCVQASGTQVVTVALRRVDLTKPQDDLLSHLDRSKIILLPNTSGARNAQEAIFLARMAREAGLGDWLKLEVIPDSQYLMPDPVDTLEAAKILVKEGFTVFPYMQADPILARKLADAGCAVVMPLASPIGSNRGLKMRETIRIIIEQAQVPVIVDAGLGAPSHACEAMEMGADAVLINTAIATAEDPVAMAEAFRHAVVAGRQAYLAGRAPERSQAQASSPLKGIIGAMNE